MTLAPLPLAGVSSVIYFGTPEVAVAPLQALVSSGCNVQLVITRPDVRRGRGGETTASPVKIAAQKLGIAVSHSAQDAVAVAKIDSQIIGVVVAFGELIKTDVLSAVPMINVHFSLLPRWRGAAPVERAILAGDTRTGACIMRVVEKLDEGEVFARSEIEITNDDDVVSLRRKLNTEAIDLLLGVLKNGFSNGVPQTGEAIYAKKITSADLRINWHAPATQVIRQVRIGGAFTFINAKRLKVVRASVVVNSLVKKLPGSICELTKTTCTVATGDGAVSLEYVQPEGKSSMSIDAWLKGARLGPDIKFGENS